jgi:HEAT repeat protein
MESIFKKIGPLYKKMGTGSLTFIAVLLCLSATAHASMLADLLDRNEYLRQCALTNICTLSDEKKRSLQEELFNILKTDNWENKCKALDAIGIISDPASAERLVPFLKDEDADVRKSAVEALAEINTQGARCAILGAANDASPKVKKAVIWELSRLKYPDSDAPAIFIKGLEDTSREVRDISRESLVKTGEPVVPALIKLLGEQSLPSRVYAEEALVKIGIPALKYLFEAFSGQNFYVKWRIVKILKEIEKNGGQSSLFGFLESSEIELKKKVKQDFNLKADSETLNSALSLLQDKNIDKSNMLGMVGYLAEQQNSKLILALVPFLFSEDEKVYTETAQALKTLEWVPVTMKEELYFYSATEQWGELAKSGHVMEAFILKLLEYNSKSDDKICEKLVSIKAIGRLRLSAGTHKLIAELEDKDRRVRLAAVEALGYIGNQESAERLFELLKNKDREIKLCVIRSLGMRGGETAIERLAECLESNDDGVREESVSALIRIGPKVDQYLKAKLESVNVTAKFSAARVIESVGSGYMLNKTLRSSLDKTLDELRQRNPIVQIRAAGELGFLSNTKATPYLLDVLKSDDSNEEVKLAVLKSLANIKDDNSIPSIINVLASTNTAIRCAAADTLESMGPQAKYYLIMMVNNDNPDIRYPVREVLSKVGGEKIVRDIEQDEHESIARGLNSENADIRVSAIREVAKKRINGSAEKLTEIIISSQNPVNVRTEALSALFTLGGSSDIASIANLLTSPEAELRESVVKFLYQSGPAVIDEVKNKLFYPDVDVREAALEVLENMDSEQIVDPLLKVLNDKFDRIVARTARKLGQTKDERAILPLIRLLKMNNKLVREEAATALINIGGAVIDRLASESGNEYFLALRTKIVKEISNEQEKTNQEVAKIPDCPAGTADGIKCSIFQKDGIEYVNKLQNPLGAEHDLPQ